VKPVVLVVDDEAYIREMLSLMLELQGFYVEEAADGFDALDKINACRPDVIILDVMMPNLDGISVCKTLRNETETSGLPIIMLSGKTQLDAEQEGLAAGANFYMFKPMKTEELISNIRTVLNEDTMPA
jgi:DNA-binding response OmpR family regulator